MWHSGFDNMMTLIGMVFIALKFNDYLLTKPKVEKIKPEMLAILAGFLSILMMWQPFRLNGMDFDLRSVPIFFISYVLGGKMGLIAGVLPSLFRIHIGGQTVYEGIIFEILFPILIGGLFYKSEKKKLPDGTFNVKRILFAYSFQCITKGIFNFYKFPVSTQELVILNITMIIFAMLALNCIILFINDYIRNKNLMIQTDKKQREIESLNKEFRRIKNALVNSINEIMILTDINGNVVTLNETFAKKLDMKVEEAIGLCVFDIIPFELREEYKNKLDKILRTKELDRFEEIIYGRYYNITIYPVLNQYGKVTNLSVISQDITELKKALEMKNRFIANVSHELKTPLNITMTYLEFLLEEQVGDLNEEQKEIVEISYNNAERLQYLINDLWELSLLESHKVKFDFTNTNLCSFVRSLIKDRSMLIEKENLNIILNVPKKDIFVITDVLRLRQVIDNILDNAVKFSEDGDIELFLQEKMDRIEICVKDYGIGIDTNKIKDIFNPFFQGDDTLRKKYKGVGLGLSIAKKIVVAMGGNIVATNNIDKGCCFKIIIPFDCSTEEETDEKDIYC